MAWYAGGSATFDEQGGQPTLRYDGTSLAPMQGGPMQGGQMGGGSGYTDALGHPTIAPTQQELQDQADFQKRWQAGQAAGIGNPFSQVSPSGSQFLGGGPMQGGQLGPGGNNPWAAPPGYAGGFGGGPPQLGGAQNGFNQQRFDQAVGPGSAFSSAGQAAIRQQQTPPGYEQFIAQNQARAARPKTNAGGWNDVARARSRAQSFAQMTPEQYAERQRIIAGYDRSR
jgi:hypothetical protein